MICLQIAKANKVIVPAAIAVKFPDFEVVDSLGKITKLPIRQCANTVNSDKESVTKASLLCLSFRANSQVMNRDTVS